MSGPAFPTTMSRSPAPKASLTRSFFCETSENSLHTLSAIVTLSLATNGPIVVSLTVKAGDHAAVQIAIELNSQVFPLNLRRVRGDVGSASA